VAIKMDDGNTARACEVVMAAVIDALLPLEAEPATLLRELRALPLRNWRGIEVGRLAWAGAQRDGRPVLGR
jgi:L-asparaginase II